MANSKPYKNSKVILNQKLKKDFCPFTALLQILPGIEGDIPRYYYNLLHGSLRAKRLCPVAEEFLNLEISRMQRDGGCHHRFYRIYQFYSLIRKYPFPGDNLLCEKAALEKFYQGEGQCADTNDRLRSYEHSLEKSGTQLLCQVREVIRKILGDEIPSNFLDVPPEFGPGSTVNVDKRDFSQTGLYFKLSDRLVVPKRAVKFLAAHMSYNPVWIDTLGLKYGVTPPIGSNRLEFELAVFKNHFVIADDSLGNKLAFVPKDSWTHRTIGVEPNGLILLQKTIGSLIRKRLKKFGVNLDTQRKNQHWARLAKTFQLATVDMANASNTISIETVKSLLPTEWYLMCDCFRSTHKDVKLKDHKKDCGPYEMFSSMGNGFTFELESLIFFAIAVVSIHNSTEKSINDSFSMATVFGDDIIVPQSATYELRSNLEWFGFEVNWRKSFYEGSFFESCGSDYFNSIDVRPFFLRRQVRTVKDLYFLSNSVVWYCLKAENDFLSPLVPYLLRLLEPWQFIAGPLSLYHDKGHTEFQFRDKVDGFEDVLRVPLTVAQALGGIKFDTSKLQAFMYKRFTHIAVEVPHTRGKRATYTQQSFKYLTFLRGTNEGKVVFRGRTRPNLQRFSCSAWNGNLTNRELARITDFFFNMPAKVPYARKRAS